jgi:hypothetical protein
MMPYKILLELRKVFRCRMHLVYMVFYTYRAHELIKFLKLKKSRHVLLILFHLFVKFQFQTHYKLDIRKKRNF